MGVAGGAAGGSGDGGVDDDDDNKTLLFVLANTRALSPGEAASRNREIVDALAEALSLEAIPESSIVLVSRGDSTLRGHGVLEPEVLASHWELRFGAIDATLHIPAFFEGGRITRNGVHFLQDQPVHTTVFARDRLFGFSTSDLAAWLEEKSDGQIRAASVARLGIERLEGEQPELGHWLEALEGHRSSWGEQLVRREARLTVADFFS